MTAPTRRQVHIDTALTNVSIAYRNESYIGEQVFPAVPVKHISDKFFVFDSSSWFRDEADTRAPGTRGPEVEYSISSSTYSCQPISATKVLPDEVVENADSPLQERRAAAEFATDKVLLKLERDVAADVFGSGWTGCSTPGTTWDDDASDPLQDVENAREGIVKLIGREPNVMVIGREVWTDLRHHPDLLDRIKYTSTGIMTPQLLAQLFEVQKLLIGNAVYDSAQEGATASLGFIWGKHAWLGWVPPNPGLMIPAAGYVFTWKRRTIEAFRRIEEKSNAYRAEQNYDVKVTCADAGYWLEACVA
jgi:hypothetical protein